MKKRVYLFLTAVVFSGLSGVYGHDDELFKLAEIKNGSNLTIIDCVSAAFKNSPKIRRQKYNLDIAKSNTGIAKSQYFPVISAGAGFYNENNSDNIYYNPHYRELPNAGVSVNKLIWNFGKTAAYIKMEEFYKIGAEYEFMDSLCAALFDVKGKYYGLLRAEAMLDIAKYNTELNEKFVKFAQNKKTNDLLTAELNLSEAKVKYTEAVNDYENEKINLSNSMYLENQIDYKIANTPTFDFSEDYARNPEKTKDLIPSEFPFSKDSAVKIAYENSPDLHVLMSTRDAMEQSLLYIKRSYYPDLSANAGYVLANSNYSVNNSLQVGVNLSSTANLMELKHSIKGAEAQIHLADNEILLFKKDLYFELQRAFNNISRAEKQMPDAKLEAVQAFKNLNTAEDLYLKNDLNYVALQDARKDYIKALTGYVDSIYNYNMALIQLEMAMHCHLADIHHKSEHALHYHSSELIEHLNKALGCDECETGKIKHKKDRL